MRALILLMALVASIAEAQTPTPSPAAIVYYDCADFAPYPSLCRATTQDPTFTTAWTRNPTTAMIAPGVSGQWDDWFASQPFAVKAGSTYYLYYDGFNRSSGIPRIGLATSTNGRTWTKYAGNPVLSPSQAWEFAGDSGMWFPLVAYDPTDPDPSQIWKMWYTTSSGAVGPLASGYATSTDGIHWTKWAGNPVLTRGPSGTWDDDHIYISNIPRRDLFTGRYYFYFGAGRAHDANGNPYDIGFGWFDDPKSTYTKSPFNPILRHKSATLLLAAGDISAGDTTIFFASNPALAGFVVGETVVIAKNGDCINDDGLGGNPRSVSTQTNPCSFVARIADMSTSTITLDRAAPTRYLVANQALVESALREAIAPEGQWTDPNGINRMWVTGFSLAPYGTFHEIGMFLVKKTPTPGPTPTGTVRPSWAGEEWMFDYSLPTWLYPNAALYPQDYHSRENMQFLGQAVLRTTATATGTATPTNTPLPPICPTCTPPAGSPLNAMGSCPGGNACCS